MRILLTDNITWQYLLLTCWQNAIAAGSSQLSATDIVLRINYHSSVFTCKPVGVHAWILESIYNDEFKSSYDAELVKSVTITMPSNTEKNYDMWHPIKWPTGWLWCTLLLRLKGRKINDRLLWQQKIQYYTNDPSYRVTPDWNLRDYEQ
jgi:hypothetical protein